jgi:hypothetical protein
MNKAKKTRKAIDLPKIAITAQRRGAVISDTSSLWCRDDFEGRLRPAVPVQNELSKELRSLLK